MVESAQTKAAVCGIGAVFIMGCLYIFGIPFLIVGIAMIATANGR